MLLLFLFLFANEVILSVFQVFYFKLFLQASNGSLSANRKTMRYLKSLYGL